jgi:Winged helix-turn helix
LESHLSSDQTAQLISHLEANTYLRSEHVCAFVEQIFGVNFTASGMAKWLTRNSFAYKKTREFLQKLTQKNKLNLSGITRISPILSIRMSPWIHQIVDQGPYKVSAETKETAKNMGSFCIIYYPIAPI